MARSPYYVPGDIYNVGIQSALDRLGQMAEQIFINERDKKKERERDYRSTMMQVMMRNAPTLPWAKYGNVVENPQAFKDASKEYEDFINISGSGASYNAGTTLSEQAMEKMTPTFRGQKYTDVTELGVGYNDVKIMDAWITGEGSEAADMNWGGLAAEYPDEFIDDADLVDLREKGLVLDSETWAEARPKLKQRWRHWKDAYMGSNMSDYLDQSEYSAIETEEINKRNSAKEFLIKNNMTYAQNLQDITKIREDVSNGGWYGSVADPDNKNIKIPVTNLVGPDGVVRAFTGTMISEAMAENLGTEWADAINAFTEFSMISSESDIMRLMNEKPQGLDKTYAQLINSVSPGAGQYLQNMYRKIGQNVGLEDSAGVGSFKSLNEMNQHQAQAVLAMDGFEELNMRLGINTTLGANLIQTFKDIQNRVNQTGQMSSDDKLKLQQVMQQLNQISVNIVSESVQENASEISKWMKEYLMSMGQGDPNRGIIAHFQKHLTTIPISQ